MYEEEANSLRKLKVSVVVNMSQCSVLCSDSSRKGNEQDGAHCFYEFVLSVVEGILRSLDSNSKHALQFKRSVCAYMCRNKSAGGEE